MTILSTSILLALLTLHLVINSTVGQEEIFPGLMDREFDEKDDDLPLISDEVVEDALKKAERSIEDEDRFYHLHQKRQTSTNSTGCKYQRRAKSYVKKIARNSEIIARAVEILSTTQHLSRDVSERLVKRTTVRPNINLNTLCQPRQIRCNPNAKFRNMDGSCNNLDNPDWGMSPQRLTRILAPKYGDGVNSPRLSSRGQALPLSRFVSTTVIPDIDTPNQRLTLISMFFGQFTDHDITSTPHRSDLTDCCSGQNNPDCLPIRVPANDPFLSRFGITCMEFSRSNRACGTGVREQMNQNTAFFDGSQIYGSNDRETEGLRAFQGGLLLTTNNGATLPVANDNTFRAGDDRVNEQPGLITMHTLFVREHNRIARALRSFAPSFSDEILFQESRRVLLAEYQSIIFNEYIPLILGPDTIKEYELNLPTGPAATAHRGKVNPNIINSFTTAAYRFGHSLIQNRFNTARSGSILLRDNFNDPTVIHRQGIEPVLLGSFQQPAQAVENFVVEAVTRFLFKEPENDVGLDLAAFNIERGREHGLPGYNDFRAACGLPRITSFDGLGAVFKDSRAPGAFRQAYQSVDDIDLWPAGIAETSVRGGQVGPTFACIIGTQYHRLLWGDRHFFTHGDQPGSFTGDERNMLKKRTLASIICDNTNAGSIQPNAFLNPSASNGAIQCSRHPKIDFRIFF